MSKRPRQLDFEALFEEEPEPVPQTGLRPVDPADSVDEWVGDRPRRQGRRPRSSKGAIEDYMGAARGRASSGDWESAPPAQVGGLMAALYAICHERVYRVKPLEALAPEAFPMVVQAAAKQHRESFGSDIHLMAEFIRWTWDRERAREERRREYNQEARRIGWRLQFGVSSPLLTDYRMSQRKPER